MTYTIHDPVDHVPPLSPTLRGDRDGWYECYRAATKAQGLWVPIHFENVRKAQNLAEAGKKREGFEAERRGTTVFLRSTTKRQG